MPLPLLIIPAIALAAGGAGVVGAFWYFSDDSSESSAHQESKFKQAFFSHLRHADTINSVNLAATLFSQLFDAFNKSTKSAKESVIILKYTAFDLKSATEHLEKAAQATKEAIEKATTELAKKHTEELEKINKALTTENKQLHEKVDVLEPQLKHAAGQLRFFREELKRNATQQVDLPSTPSPTQ